MEFVSVKEYAEKYGMSERTVRNQCAQGKIPGFVLFLLQRLAELATNTWKFTGYLSYCTESV